jgi:hypothetical protein
MSLALFAFCPTILANGPLVTSDMAVTLFFSATMLCLWRVLHRVDLLSVVAGSLVLGCLFVSKFSAILIVPMGFVLVVLQLISPQPTMVTFGGRTWTVERRGARLFLHLATIAVHMLLAWVVIWSFFNFRYNMFATTKTNLNEAGQTVVVDRPSVPWELLLKDSPSLAAIVNPVREMHLLPEAYLYGFVYTLRCSERRNAFFNGEVRLTGWREFFPFCLMVKTPLTFFVLLGLAAAWVACSWYAAGERWRVRAQAMLQSLYRSAPLWVLFVVYWAVAITSRLNIGHRHLLPTYPPMLIFAGVSSFWLATSARDANRPKIMGSRWLATRRWPAAACAVLLGLGLFAAESLWCWPNYLTYFNQSVGGPSNAYRYLVDSSLDWGQDLPALRRWLDNHRDSSLSDATYFSYFGVSSPQLYGIPATSLASYPRRSPPAVPEPLRPGTYCVSATMLQNVYTDYRGRWTPRYEVSYQELVSKVREFQTANSNERRQLIVRNGEEFWNHAFSLYEQARFARLCSFLRQREPDEQVNYSILIYRLNAANVAAALDGPPVELGDAQPSEDVVADRP